MARTRMSTLCDFIIRPEGFDLDFPEEVPEGIPETELMEDFLKDRYQALYEISFREPLDWYPVSLLYLHRVGAAFVRYMVGKEDIEAERGDIRVDEGVDLMKMVGPAPFIPGSEYVCAGWIRHMWESLLDVFRRQIAKTDETVEAYVAEKNQGLHVPGKIFFHLVENKGDDAYPFAFMATYSPEAKRTHVPLRYVLEEYRGDRDRLLELLSNLDAVASKRPTAGAGASGSNTAIRNPRLSSLFLR